jgi:hypothetical protein
MEFLSKVGVSPYAPGWGGNGWPGEAPWCPRGRPSAAPRRTPPPQPRTSPPSPSAITHTRYTHGSTTASPPHHFDLGFEPPSGPKSQQEGAVGCGPAGAERARWWRGGPRARQLARPTSSGRRRGWPAPRGGRTGWRRRPRRGGWRRRRWGARPWRDGGD